MPFTTPRRCPITDTLELVGERWSLLILREAFLGVHRFAEIAANIGAPRDVLTKRLRSLEAAGVLERRGGHERPARGGPAPSGRPAALADDAARVRSRRADRGRVRRLRRRAARTDRR